MEKMISENQVETEEGKGSAALATIVKAANALETLGFKLEDFANMPDAEIRKVTDRAALYQTLAIACRPMTPERAEKLQDRMVLAAWKTLTRSAATRRKIIDVP